MPCVCLVSTCLTDLYVSVSFSFHFSLIWYELLKLLFETHINMLWFNSQSITTRNLFKHATLWAQHTQLVIYIYYKVIINSSKYLLNYHLKVEIFFNWIYTWNIYAAGILQKFILMNYNQISRHSFKIQWNLLYWR